MNIKLDKFFIGELQKAGYVDLDFKKLRDIYSKSRENPECRERKVKKRKARESLNNFYQKEFSNNDF